MDLISLHDIPDSEDRYTKFLRNVCEKFEFDDAAYAGINPIGGVMHAIVTYSDEWQQYYQARIQLASAISDFSFWNT